MQKFSLEQLLAQTRAIWTGSESVLGLGSEKERIIRQLSHYIQLIEERKVDFVSSSPKQEYTPIRYALAGLYDDVFDVISNSNLLESNLNALKVFAEAMTLANSLQQKIAELSDKTSMTEGHIQVINRHTNKLILGLRILEETLPTLPNT